MVSNESSEKNAVDDENEEERDDPLNEFRTPTTETCLQSVLPDYPITKEQNRNTNSSGNEVFNIVPGENKHPVSFMTDKHCEELAFPVLFPKGRFGYTAERAVNLSPTKYFNACHLHYSGKFAMNPEYVFFAQFIIEQKSIGQHKHCSDQSSWTVHHCITFTIKSAKFTKSYMSRPDLFISKTNPRHTTLLANIYVRSCCRGKTAWYSHLVYDTVLC